MFNKLTESFLVIDAKDKPAPSFLTAYIFTWITWQYEATLAFFKTSGDFTKRFNASYIATVEDQFFIVLGLTLVLVIVRFGLNNLIYYMREYLDNLTQNRLDTKGHKSFVSNEVFQNLKKQNSTIQAELFASQDSQKAAKIAENKATTSMLDLTIDRDKYQNSLDVSIKENKTLNEQLENLNDLLKVEHLAVDDLKENAKKNSDAYSILTLSNKALSTDIHTIAERLQTWGNNANNYDIKLLSLSDSETSDDDADAIDRLLKAEVIYHDAPENVVIGLLTKLNNYKSPTESALGDIDNLFNKEDKNSISPLSKALSEFSPKD